MVCMWCGTDIKYNGSKSVTMNCRTKENVRLKFPDLPNNKPVLPNNNLGVCNKVKYFGQFMMIMKTFIGNAA